MSVNAGKQEILLALVQSGHDEAALFLVNRFGASHRVLDVIITYYLRKCANRGRLFALDDAVKAYNFSKLGASHRVVEQVITQLIRIGFLRETMVLTKYVNRDLTSTEALALSRSYYTKDYGFDGDAIKMQTIQMAQEYCNDTDLDTVMKEIREKEHRMADFSI